MHWQSNHTFTPLGKVQSYHYFAILLKLYSEKRKKQNKNNQLLIFYSAIYLPVPELFCTYIFIVPFGPKLVRRTS